MDAFLPGIFFCFSTIINKGVKCICFYLKLFLKKHLLICLFGFFTISLQTKINIKNKCFKKSEIILET